MKIFTTKVVMLSALLISINSFGQIRPILEDPIDDDDCLNCPTTSVSLSGSTNVNLNGTYSYSVSVTTGLHSASNYTVSGGQIVSQSRSTVSVKWTSTGSRWVRVNATVSGGLYSATKYVNVISPLIGGSVSASTSSSICNGVDPGTINNSSSPSGGNGSFSYQWQRQNSGGPTPIDGDSGDGGIGDLSGSWSNIAGATGSSYNPPKLYANTSYRRRVQSGGQIAYSNTIRYTIVSVSAGSISYGGGNVNVGSTPSKITGTTASGSAVAYQWQRKVGTASSYSNISGATGRDYQPGSHTKTTVYRRRVVSCGQTKYSNSITIRVNLKAGGISASTTTSPCYNGNPGSISNSSSPSGGNGSYAYQWQQRVYSGGSYGSWTNISGGTSSTYNPPALTANRKYRRRVISDGQTKYTSEITFTVKPNLNQGSISYSGSRTLNPGGNPSTISGSTPTGGDGSFTYQWQKKTTGGYSNISGATAKTYNPGALNTTTTFRRRVISCGQTKYTNEIKFTINLTGGTIAASTATLICSGTNPGNINNGSSANGGSGSYSYQWQSLSESGLVELEDQPDGLDGGGGASLTWSNISGATSSSYNPPTLNGSTSYRRRVTSNGSTAYSNIVGYSLSSLNQGTISYSGDNINSGITPAKITGTDATGAGVAYQWQSKVGTSSSYTNISGATSRDYQPGSQTKTTAYRRRVISCGQTKYSNEITIRVNLVGGSISASTSTSLCYNGDPGIINNSSTPKGGNGSFVYQWQQSVYSNGSYGSWTNISGATSSTYNPPALTANRKYRRRVKSDGQTKYSGVITYSVKPNLNHGSISYLGSTAINPGSNPANISGSTPTGGNGTYTYQWQKKTTGGYTNISGATGKDYNPGVLNVTTTFRRRTISCQTKTSNEIKFTVNLVGGNVTASSSTSICSNEDPEIINNTASGAGGIGSYSYQWEYLSGDGIQPVDQTIDQIDGGNDSSPSGFNWQSIAGATSVTFNPPALTTNRSYRRKVSSGSDEAYSNIINYVIAAPVNKGSISYNGGAVNPGSTPAKISGTTATGGTGISYRWQWKRGSETSFSNIPSNLGSSVTSRDYQPQGLSTNTVFRRRVSSCGQNYYTNQITINVNLIAGSVSGNQTICSGSDPSNISSSSVAAGGNGTYNYKWEKREYKPSQITPTGPGDQQIIDDGSGDGIDSPGGDTQVVYSWTEWTEIASGTSHDPSPISYKTQFRRKVNSGGVIKYSNTVTKDVYDLASPGTISYNGGVVNPGSAPGQSISGTVGSGGSSVEYQWQKKTTGGYTNIPGATNQNYQPTSLTRTTTFKRLTITNCGSTASSNEVEIIVNLYAGAIASGNEAICRGSAPDAIASTAPASGSIGNYTYQWQVLSELTLQDGESFEGEETLLENQWHDLPGETNQTFDPPVLTSNTTYRRKVTSGTQVAFTAPKSYSVSAPLTAGSISYSGGSVNPGGNPIAIIGTSVTGGISPKYQWQSKVGTAAGFTDITGATSKDYNPPAGIDFTTTYKRRVKSCGETKFTAPVTVNVSFNAGSIVGDQVICSGADPDVISSGSPASGGLGDFDYQWEKNVYSPVDIGPIDQSIDGQILQDGDNSNSSTIDSPIDHQWTGWHDVTGQKSVSLNLSAQTYVTQYRRKVVSGGITEYSNVVTIDVEELPDPGTITYSGGTINPGSNATEIVGSNVTSVFNLRYKWSKKVASGFVDIPNSNTPDLAPGQLDFSTIYVRFIENDCGQIVNSNTVKIPVKLIAGNTSTTSYKICHDCAKPTLSPESPMGGNGQYTYQWQIQGSLSVQNNDQTIDGQDPSPIGGEEFTDIALAKNANYTPEMLWVGTRTFRRMVKSDGQVFYSQPISITVYPALNPGTVAYDLADPCSGSNVGTISGTSPTGGNDSYEYQWQYYNGSGWSTFSSSNAQSFNPNFIITSNTRFRRRVRSAGSEWKKSNEITIEVYEVLDSNDLGSISASNDKMCPGDLVEFVYSPGPKVNTAWTRLFGSKEGVEGEIDFGKIKDRLSIHVQKGYNYYVKYLQRCTVIDYPTNSVSFSFYENCNVPPSMDQNFVRTEVPKIPITDEFELAILDASEKAMSYAYSDGLGRPTMSVAVEAGQNFEDAIQFSKYNDQGRQEISYMPYYKESMVPGQFIDPDDAIDEQSDFYNAAKSNYDDIAHDNNPYTKTEWDARGRVKSVIAPGEAWHSDGGKKTTYNYAVFDPTLAVDKPWSIHAPVIKWTIENGLPKHDGTYVAKELSISSVTDVEGRKTRKVTDARGLTVTSQIYDSDQKKWIGSYQVYDDFGRVRFVIPPLLVEISTPSQVQVDELAFQYVYDNKGRVTDQSAPGAGWVRYVYDHWNRLVLIRHSAQRREDNKYWTFYKYDAMNRQIMSGEILEPRNRDQLQDALDEITANSKRFETRNPDVSRGYTKYKSFPNLNADYTSEQYEILTINYFDDYDFINYPGWDNEGHNYTFSNPLQNPNYGWGPEGYEVLTQDKTIYSLAALDGKKYALRQGVSIWLKSLSNPEAAPTKVTAEDAITSSYDFDIVSANLHNGNAINSVTGSKVKILGTNIWLNSVVYYDERGRVIQTVSENHKGGIDRLSNDLDWKGELQNMLVEHASSSDHVTLLSEYEYAQNGQLLKTWQTINEGERILVGDYHYNVWGELVEKNLHGTLSFVDGQSSISDGEMTFLQSVDYRYNLQGALTKINDPSRLNQDRIDGTQENDLFGMEYFYEKSATINGSGTKGRYDGLVNAMVWNANNLEEGDFTKTGIAYAYDDQSRLQSTSYGSGVSLDDQASKDSYSVLIGSYDENDNYISGYDDNGNILSLTRNADGAEIDNLTYTYQTNSNKLTKVSDSDSDKGFSNLNGSTVIDYEGEYDYDGMGNMTFDAHKSIELHYNHMQLVDRIDFIDAQTDQVQSSIVYTYDAARNRLAKQVLDADGNSIARVDYVGLVEYMDDDINQVFTDEGRAYKQNGEYHYEYFITDHQGNNRVAFGNLPERNVYTAAIEERRSAYEESEFTFPTNWQASNENHTPLGKQSIQLNATQGRILGLAKVLDIQPGDEVDIESWVKYGDNLGGTNTTEDLLNALLTAFNLNPADGGLGETFNGSVYNNGNGLSGLFGGANNADEVDAYVAFLFFDEQGNFEADKSNYLPVGSEANGVWTKLSLIDPIVYDEAGQLFIYMANETAQNREVYFDDLKIVHSSATSSFKVSQVNDFYPFGLPTSNSWRSPGYIDPGLMYQSSYASYDSLTGYYDFLSRSYDPVLGRFFAVDPAGQFSSPYTGMGNMPHWGTDPNGEIFGLAGVFGAIVKGALVSALSHTASVAVSDGGFQNWSWNNFGNSVLQGGVSGAVSFGVGEMFGPTSTEFGYEMVRGGFHAATQAGVAALFGNDPNAAFGSALTGSMISSKLDGSSGLAQVGLSALGGGLTSIALGGDFWDGFATGGVVAATNHALHKISAKQGLETYEVKEGETLDMIVRKKYPGLTDMQYSDLVLDIAAINGINLEFPIVTAGQSLKIYQAKVVFWRTASSQVKYSKAWHDSVSNVPLWRRYWEHLKDRFYERNPRQGESAPKKGPVKR